MDSPTTPRTETAPITRMADGTIKQINPLSGTQVWTIPGRANRPLEVATTDPRPVAAEAAGQHCTFCSGRYLETPPEKARIVRDKDGNWQTLLCVAASQLFDTVAEFRRIPNLFEILSLEYWQANYGYVIPSQVLNRRDAYLTEDMGWEHVLAIVRTKLQASGFTNGEIDALDERTLISFADAFFASGHDVIVARRHYAEDATSSVDLASSGSLTVDEHRQYISMSVETMRDLHRKYPHAKYVAAFQNWLRPAGASFDHLHKQLVTIDERGVQAERELAKVASDPEIYNRLAVDYAIAHRLVIAENDHAIAFAGFGHRFPTLEIYSKSTANFPWKHHPDVIAAMSDLIHACHVATGPQIASNEEWYYRPPDVETRMPWRVMLKWRVSTLAGFEGGTKINVNTIDPFTLAARALDRLDQHREQIAPTIAIGPECPAERGCLAYTNEK